MFPSAFVVAALLAALFFLLSLRSVPMALSGPPGGDLFTWAFRRRRASTCRAQAAALAPESRSPRLVDRLQAGAPRQRRLRVVAGHARRLHLRLVTRRPRRQCARLTRSCRSTSGELHAVSSLVDLCRRADDQPKVIDVTFGAGHSSLKVKAAPANQLLPSTGKRPRNALVPSPSFVHRAGL